MPERLCRACGNWHDLDQPWPCARPPIAARSDLSRPMVISDIREYRAVAIDGATGKRPMITGRRQHREFLQRNGLRELGNDMPAVKHEQLSQTDRVADIKRAMGE